MENSIFELTIKSNRPSDFKGSDNVELFNAVERAFEWEKNEHPYVNVEGNRFVSYKRIVRDLAGCDADVTGYRIGGLRVEIECGEWPDYQILMGEKLGMAKFILKCCSISGEIYTVPMSISVSRSQFQNNIAISSSTFFLSNDTSLELLNGIIG